MYPWFADTYIANIYSGDGLLLFVWQEKVNQDVKLKLQREVMIEA